MRTICHPEQSEGSGSFAWAANTRFLVAPLLGMTEGKFVSCRDAASYVSTEWPGAVYCFSSFSIAEVTSGESGVTAGSKR
jgi:hypothetical protein